MQKHILILSGCIFFDALASASSPINQTNHLESPSNHKPSAASPYSLQQVQQLRKEGKLAEAKTLAQAYLQQHPNDGDMLFVLGLIHYQQKNLKEASSCFSRVLAKTPTYMDARIALIRTKILDKKYQEASNLIVVGLYQNPKQPELLELKSMIIQEVSVSSAKELLKKQPVEATTHSVAISTQVTVANKPPIASLAEIKTLRAQGKLSLAKEKALHNLKANPKDLDSELLLGLICLQLNDYPQARAYLTNVLTQKPDYLDARVGLIKLNLTEKKFTKAQDLIKQGMITNPHNSQSLLLLKRQLADLSNPQKAISVSLPR